MQELGIPTANVDQASLHGTQCASDAVTGIYAGWASVGSSLEVYPMVASVGFNPFYGNKVRSLTCRARPQLHAVHVRGSTSLLKPTFRNDHCTTQT